jgi:lipopolysaccharide/colanic/teichoic acid biosynthesis glycosyltransferase
LSAEPATSPGPLPIRRSKRLFDVMLCLMLLTVFLPLLVVMVVFLWLEHRLVPDSRGPLFYREPRISRGREFGIIKFRTVRQAAIDETLRKQGKIKTIKELEKIPGNVTWSGRFLRDYYLDELPQLVNILCGDMSFVGPRPWPPEDCAEAVCDGVNTKCMILCGLTGPVQMRKGQSIDWLKLDMEYIEAYTRLGPVALIWLDLRILTRSIKTFVEGKGL